MSKSLLLTFVLCSVLGGVLVFSGFVGFRDVWAGERSSVVQADGLNVHNLNSTLSYSSIQAAINAPETLPGHVIQVNSGIYRERVSVNKPLSLVGQGSGSTVIDGFGGTVVQVGSDDVEIRGFTMQNGTYGILLRYSNNVRIADNVVSGGLYGIRGF